MIEFRSSQLLATTLVSLREGGGGDGKGCVLSLCPFMAAVPASLGGREKTPG